jgi:hypothetical protein
MNPSTLLAYQRLAAAQAQSLTPQQLAQLQLVGQLNMNMNMNLNLQQQQQNSSQQQQQQYHSQSPVPTSSNSGLASLANTAANSDAVREISGCLFVSPFLCRTICYLSVAISSN